MRGLDSIGVKIRLSSPGLTRLDPAIHRLHKRFLAKMMDARVKPAHDDLNTAGVMHLHWLSR
jgi:hypothetical protein